MILTGLCLVWYIVAFLFSHHQWFVRPIQPLHFTRGYTWAPLFLMGANNILLLLNSILHTRRKFIRVAGIAGFVLLMVSDNIVWFTWTRQPNAA